MIHIVNVVGARPNFMKIAPLMREYARHRDAIEATLVHTGQHYDEGMSDVFFAELGIPRPRVYLEVGSGTHAAQTARIMERFERVLMERRPDLVLVVGDVNSTLACTLVAAKMCVPVAHVEAGLRSNDRTMPEEINRLVTDAVSDFLFTTSRDADENLMREGVARERIFFVGNTMIDTLTAMRPALAGSTIRQSMGLNGHPFGLVTLHRPSNVDDRSVLAGICSSLERIQSQVTLVWPVHPRTHNKLSEFGLLARLQALPGLRLTKPLGYVDTLSLMAAAAIVLTDSGGIQEETTALGIPCLTLRKNTERPVTVTQGTNEVVGSDPALITMHAQAILSGKKRKGQMPELWDGKASQRIVSVLLEKMHRP